MSDFKDLFSKQSQDYARFRPTYPPALFQYLASLVPNGMAWDAGTGNGQAAVALAEFFPKVIATDPSEKQLANAIRHPRVEYLECPAEATPIYDRKINLITAAQAAHWFNLEEFYLEARRVAIPGKSAIALWCYGLAAITPEVDAVVGEFYSQGVGKYWEPERKLVEKGYSDIEFPFVELMNPEFGMEASWSLAHLVGYLGTWSAVAAAKKALGKDPVQAIVPALAAAWGGDPAAEKRVRWKLALRVGQI